MKVWKFCLFFFLLLSSTLGEDTVAEDISVHQLERLVELLTSTECEDLLFALSHPEENIFQHAERLSPEKNQLDVKPRAKRDTSSATDGEAQCRTALTDWLLRYGEQTYYDRLSRALQHIGRTDIAIEVGKNINQDKLLSLKRYVEDYHKYVSSLNSPPAQSDTKDRQRGNRRVRRRQDVSFMEDLKCQNLPISLSTTTSRANTEAQYRFHHTTSNYDKYDKNNAVSDKVIIHAVYCETVMPLSISPPSDGNVPVWHRRTTNYPAWRLLPPEPADTSTGNPKRLITMTMLADNGALLVVMAASGG
ncbi:hypothetical protein ABVT39_020950 [Epinephelus coioides]